MLVLRPTPLLARLLLAAVLAGTALAAAATTIDVVDVPGIAAKTMVDFFHPDREHSVLSWFQSLQLLLCGLLAWSIFSGGAALGSRLAWAALACGFVYLSVDEAAVIHERMHVLVPEAWKTGAFRFAWVLPAMAILAALAPCFWRLLAELPHAHRRRLLVAAGVYLGGAIGLEMVDGAVQTAHGAGTAYWTLVVVEEAMEMTGQWLAVRAFAGIVAEPAAEPELPATAVAV